MLLHVWFHLHSRCCSQAGRIVVGIVLYHIMETASMDPSIVINLMQIGAPKVTTSRTQ